MTAGHRRALVEQFLQSHEVPGCFVHRSAPYFPTSTVCSRSGPRGVRPGAASRFPPGSCPQGSDAAPPKHSPPARPDGGTDPMRPPPSGHLGVHDGAPPTAVDTPQCRVSCPVVMIGLPDGSRPPPSDVPRRWFGGWARRSRVGESSTTPLSRGSSVHTASACLRPPLPLSGPSLGSLTMTV